MQNGAVFDGLTMSLKFPSVSECFWLCLFLFWTVVWHPFGVSTRGEASKKPEGMPPTYLNRRRALLSGFYRTFTMYYHWHCFRRVINDVLIANAQLAIIIYIVFRGDVFSCDLEARLSQTLSAGCPLSYDGAALRCFPIDSDHRVRLRVIIYWVTGSLSQNHIRQMLRGAKMQLGTIIVVLPF